MDRRLDKGGPAIKAFPLSLHGNRRVGFGPAFLLFLAPVTFLGLFYFYPIAKIFLLSFGEARQWAEGGMEKLFQSGQYFRIFGFTFWQAAVSALLTLVTAFPGAWVFARFQFPGKKLFQAFVTVPFVLPTIVVAAAFQALLGSRGLINEFLMEAGGFASPPLSIDRTLWFILLAHVFFNYAVVLRMVGGFWSRIGNTAADAAKMLGASPLKVFFHITLPLLRPAVMAAGLMVFIFCFSSFGIILILGGPQFSTLEVEIYRQAVYLFNLPLAAALSLMQILCTFLLMWIYTGLQRRVSVPISPVSRSDACKFPENRREKWAVGMTLLFIIGFLGLPLGGLVSRSLQTADGWSLAWYFSLFVNEADSVFFVPPLEAVLNSVGFAGLATVMALVIGGLGAFFLAAPNNRLAAVLDPVFMLPLSTSAVTLGFGFVVALDQPPLNLRNSLLLVPIAHTLVAFPFVVRSLLPALRSIPHSLREAASLLGASPGQVWRAVDLPIAGRALTVGAVFAFTVSLGEFGATVFVARPHMPTMPLAIYRFLGQPGAANYGQAMAMSSLLMLVTAAGFLCIERIRTGGMGEF